MARPHGLLRAGFPYFRTLGMRRITSFPADIAFSGKGDAYILMRSEGVAVIRIWPLEDEEIFPEVLKGIGSYGTGNGQFIWPVQIVTDRNGHIFVSDEATHRITQFDQDGEFDRPAGIAVDAHGDIYVADWGNDRVQLFNSEGHYIWSFRGDASLSRVARQYMMTNAVPNRLREVGRLEQEKYLRRPRSVRIDDEFRLFIPDYESYRIQVYEKDAILLDETQFAPHLRNPTLAVT